MTNRSGDLLYGSRAIAAHLGIRKGTAIHLIRAGLIPWFALGGVACARRSTLAAHFAALEDEAGRDGGASRRSAPSG